MIKHASVGGVHKAIANGYGSESGGFAAGTDGSCRPENALVIWRTGSHDFGSAR